VLDAFGTANVHATGHGHANDLYSHLVLTYALSGDAWQLSAGHAELHALCAPLVKVLEARQLGQVAFDAAMQPLPGTMLLKGFVDITLMAYFFESL